MHSYKENILEPNQLNLLEFQLGMEEYLDSIRNRNKTEKDKLTEKFWSGEHNSDFLLIHIAGIKEKQEFVNKLSLLLEEYQG